MNKQSPEYIRVREEIAKKRCEPCLFRSQYRGCIAHTDIKNCETSQTFADSILEIKGIVVISNNQKEPEALPDPHPEWNKGLRFMTWNDCWEATQNEHFKRLVE